MTKSLFKKISDAYCDSYKGERTVESVVAGLRQYLQFNDKPTYSDMRKGIVDCVGASVIACNILSRLFKDCNFFVVSLPGVPWLPSRLWDSKHTGVLEILKNGHARILDVTPINGYGYGIISDYLPYTFWKQLHKTNQNSQNLHSENLRIWRKLVYPFFAKLSNRDVESMLAISHCKVMIEQGRKCVLPKHIPIKSPGWAKDYWRLVAQKAIREKKIINAKMAFREALKFAPHNVYLLREFAFFLENTNELKESREVYLQANSVTTLLVKNQKKIIKFWDQEFRKMKRRRKWEVMIYYGGSIFWRRQSNLLLENKRLEQVSQINYQDVPIPIYRFSAGWFNRKKMNVGIIRASSNVRGCVAQIMIPNSTSYGVNFRHEYVNKLPFGEWKCVIAHKKTLEKANCIHISKTPIESHVMLVGMVQPELLIV